MTPYAQMLLAHIRPESQGAYAYEYRQFAKDPSIGLILTILLGIVGGEAYYMGDYKRGILMTLGLFSGIGLFVTVPMWIARCFTISGECEAYNDYLAYMLAFRYAPDAIDAPQPPHPPQQAPAPGARPNIGGVPMRATGI
ncbi:MAG TPA: hypothetical protein VGN11_10635 [Candidatus Baltobacteraceae bacterium]|jgi:hypothetical protein|nr:hypothetical protein [Candidatus Baltobacteraceae bacterium]